MNLKRLAKSFAAWALLLNLPILALPLAPSLMMLPALLWINVPASWCGLASLLGAPHFKNSAFGPAPETLWAWLALACFWLTAAALLALAEHAFRKPPADEPPV